MKRCFGGHRTRRPLASARAITLTGCLLHRQSACTGMHLVTVGERGFFGTLPHNGTFYR